MRATLRTRRWAGAAGLLLGAALAAGCAPEPAVTASPSPTPTVTVAPPTVEERAAVIVGGMSVSEQAASIVMGHIASTDPSALNAYMTQGLGGFLLMGANIPATDAELPALTAALAVDPELPPLIAIDEEGGSVTRLNDDTLPGADVLKSLPTADTTAAFAARAELLVRAGVTVNFGTVADISADPGSFIHGRALGTEPAGAAERVAAATEAQEMLVASTLKHFPGHGAAPGDSHRGIPSSALTLDAWRQADAVPFTAGIDAGARLLMFGHLAYPAIDPAPASLSASWHDIARAELGFDGVAVTDDLGMLASSGDSAYADPVANAVAAVAAGNDLVLTVFGSTAETAGSLAAGIAAAVEAGALPAERLEEAALRVMTLRLQLS
ncbi:glycoside hydrolase family 3 N-terminal domain-containing protein [Microbacterium hydrocarbonoxydans]|uniref:glycoside hydrolase family 3 N-terminal domain-containing protein n=1 Tax=Microbacterium hydrocarbonoxydans TaxID=273678 RepID=UPI001FB918D0|nr:glycoside hydrolase family 3 N-terminal domain-containing protein [Microbacterium hydrocarbonoxydans]